MVLTNVDVHLSLCRKKFKIKKLTILLAPHTQKEEMKKKYTTDIKAQQEMAAVRLWP